MKVPELRKMLNDTLNGQQNIMSGIMKAMVNPEKVSEGMGHSR